MRIQLIPFIFCMFFASATSLFAENDPCQYDNYPPIAICDHHTVVSLGADGVAEVYAQTIDDGSYDNCGIALYEIRRMSQGWCPSWVDDDTYFGPKTGFCCEDVGTLQWVVLRVTDTNGNSNTCMAEVTVQSNLYPNFECPPNIEISCDFWYSESDLYNVGSHTFGTIVPAGETQQPIVIYDPGNPTKPQPYTWGYDGSASCGGGCNGGWGGQMPWISVEVHDYRNSCGIGVIQRKFLIECNGWTDWCTQTITVKDFNYGGAGINWPDNYNVTDCGANLDLYDPNLLPAPYGKPVVSSGGSCSLIGIAYKDLVFTFVDGVCYKILREWTVIDWCTYNPDYPWSGGIWKHTQIIKINNQNGPVINDCVDVVVEGQESTCAGRFTKSYDVNDDCTPVNKLKYDYKIDLHSNGSYDISHVGNGHPTVDKVLPLGWHKILLYVEDQCGNTTTCSHNIHVVDKKKPTPVCINGLSSVVMPIGGMVTIWAKDFDVSSEDNCTPPSLLKFSFSSNVNERSRVFDCDDVGVVPVQIWVTDQYNNQQYCSTFIQIDDNEGACVGTNPIQGRVSSFDGVSIPDAAVDLYKIMPDASLESDRTTQMTDELGNYTTGFGTTSYDRQLMVTRDGNPLAGLSTLDLVYLQRHILGLEELTKPEQYKAADLDGSGRVGVMDLMLLRNALLGGVTDEIDLGWYFYDQTCTWDQPADILDGGCQDGYTIDQNSAFPMPVDFNAVKMGDINQDLTNTAWLIETRSAPAHQIVLQTQDTRPGEIQFVSKETMNSFGFQFSIPLPAAGFSLEDGLTSVNGQSMRIDEENELIHISIAKKEAAEWLAGEALFAMTMDQEDLDQYLDQWSTDHAEGLVAEIYDEEKNAIDVEISIDQNITPQNEQNDLHIVTITPNPMTDFSLLQIDHPFGTESGLIEIYNEIGSLVYRSEIDVHTGQNRYALAPADLGASGVYYYSVTVGENLSTGKLIKL